MSGIAVGLVRGDSVGLLPDRRTCHWLDFALFCLHCLLSSVAYQSSDTVDTLYHRTSLTPGYCVAIHTIILLHNFSCYVFNTLVKVTAAGPETLRRLHNSSSNYIGTKESVATKAA